VIDNKDDPLVTVVNGNADFRETIVDRGFTWPNSAIVASSPITALVAWLGVLRSRRGAKGLSAWAQVLFLALIAGVGASLWPEAVPGAVSIWQNASMHRANVILGNSILVIVPLLLLYGYWWSHGKTVPHELTP